jgi:hypothetical protein
MAVMSVYLPVCLSLCDLTPVSDPWNFHLSVCLSTYLSICLSVYLSVYLSIYLSIYLSFLAELRNYQEDLSAHSLSCDMSTASFTAKYTECDKPLRLIPRLLVSSIFPSMTCSRRQLPFSTWLWNNTKKIGRQCASWASFEPGTSQVPTITA